MAPIYAVSTRSPVERLLYTIWSFRLKTLLFRNGTTSCYASDAGNKPTAVVAVMGFVSLALWYCCCEPSSRRRCDRTDDNINHRQALPAATADRYARPRLSPLLQRILATASTWKRRYSLAIENEEGEVDASLLLEEEEETIDVTVMNHIGTCLCESVCFSVGSNLSRVIGSCVSSPKYSHSRFAVCLSIGSRPPITSSRTCSAPESPATTAGSGNE